MTDIAIKTFDKQSYKNNTGGGLTESLLIEIGRLKFLFL